MSVELKNNSYLFGNNSAFIEFLYKKYTEDPNSVDASWQDYFKSFSDESNSLINSIEAKKAKNSSIFHSVKSSIVKGEENNQLAVTAVSLINAYIEYGHTAVSLDPLNLTKSNIHPSLNLENYGLSESDLNSKIDFGDILNLGNISISQALEKAKLIYSDKIASEFSYIEDCEEKKWITERLEQILTIEKEENESKKQVLNHLLEVTYFEDFLHVKFPGIKRFSIRGGEAAIAAIEIAMKSSVAFGVEEMVIGMAHRGRLNVLTKTLGKPYYAMLSEFVGIPAFPEDINMPGDVKYHLGASIDREIDGKKIHLSLTPNPSHLEAVNSVVLGRVRAKQKLKKDEKRQKVMALLVHGDAALAGQGSVFESIMSSQINAYKVGGALHIVINNQIGFTTNIAADRFGRYCTDIAKAINAPIFHVNGDDVESVVLATKIASEYRAKFNKDVFLDIVCYRKYGHNEGDEPMFTQPVMYEKIDNQQNVSDLYAKKLISENVIKELEYQEMIDNFKNFLNSELEKARAYKPMEADWFGGIWSDFKYTDQNKNQQIVTGVEKASLVKLGEKLATVPPSFNLNSKIARLFQAKIQMLKNGDGLDWAMGEALAYASLLTDGFEIRVTGQDSERGTFSHRHAVLIDQVNESRYIPLNNLENDQKAKLEINNGNLSEFAALAFEYGYSFSSPRSLVIWEAQFGDFANGAQVIIDQFIAAGEAKWLRASGLVLLLPHGYEGQGPEHSSARLERFLQLCAQDNIQVVNCTTPASFFHVLRRQMHQNYRKPLIVMTPKSLLRHKLATSSLFDMEVGTKFQLVIDDLEVKADAKRVILCSGKVYYDLFEKRQLLDSNGIALIRIEQLYPFPNKELKEILLKHPNAEFIWCQEEHRNGGAYFFVKDELEKILKEIDVNIKELLYVGRSVSASTAAGYTKLHVEELNNFITKALS